jgi:hypothetical protein
MRRALLAFLCLAAAAMGAAVEHPVSVLGRVYIDVNCNGCIDEEDVLVNGVSIQLQKANGEVVGIAQTGEFGVQGLYAFPSDLAPVSPETGTTYNLAVMYPNGYYPKNARPGPYSQKINNGTLRFNLPTSFENTASSYDFLLKRNGCFFTENQCGWGHTWHWCWQSDFLTGYFEDVYGNGPVTIGGEKTLSFTSAAAIKRFLPQNGSPKILTSSAQNPTNNRGEFSGNVLALQLSVDFSDKGVTTAFLGEQRIRHGAMQGTTVREVLRIANEVLGGNLDALPSGVSLSKLNQVVENIVENYDGGHEDHRYLDW